MTVERRSSYGVDAVEKSSTRWRGPGGEGERESELMVVEAEGIGECMTGNAQ